MDSLNQSSITSQSQDLGYQATHKLLQDQQQEVQKLRDQIHQRDSEILTVSQENDALNKILKRAEVNKINHQHLCYNQFEKVDEVSDDLFLTLLREMEVMNL